ncbi:MAG: DUF2783 domain-containing protein [Pseudomonadota bacterium]
MARFRTRANQRGADPRAGKGGADDAESAALNARLILFLANHIGDRDTLRAALTAAQ